MSGKLENQLFKGQQWGMCRLRDVNGNLVNIPFLGSPVGRRANQAIYVVTVILCKCKSETLLFLKAIYCLFFF